MTNLSKGEFNEDVMEVLLILVKMGNIDLLYDWENVNVHVKY